MSYIWKIDGFNQYSQFWPSLIVWKMLSICHRHYTCCKVPFNHISLMETSCELCKFICKIFKLSPQKPCKVNFFKASLEVSNYCFAFCDIWSCGWLTTNDNWLFERVVPIDDEEKVGPHKPQKPVCVCVCVWTGEKNPNTLCYWATQWKPHKESPGWTSFTWTPCDVVSFGFCFFFCLYTKAWLRRGLANYSLLFWRMFKIFMLQSAPALMFSFYFSIFFYIYRCSGSVSSLCSRLYKCTAYLLFSFPQSE